MSEIEKITCNLLKKSQLKIVLLGLLFSFLLSSCKIFRSSKKSDSKIITGHNTHTHSDNISNKNIEEIIILARNYTGVPYQLGGNSVNGFDCSGLIFAVCKTIGVSIPRISYQQAEIGEEVKFKEIRKGDLVFFNTAKNSNQISHVGLVTEVNPPQNIMFIHSSTSKGVREDNLFSDYWKKAFTKATRPFVF